MTNQATTTTKEALDPCPFCGGEAFLTEDDLSEYPADGKVWHVTCLDSCPVAPGVYGQATRDEAIRKWNTRVSAPIVAPEVDDLQRRLYEECITANWDPERKNTFAEEIAHLHEELSEAFRAWRRYKDCEVREVNGKLEGVPIEFADALIGMFYNAELYGFDLLAAVERKHQFNLGRNYVAEGRQLHARAPASTVAPQQSDAGDRMFAPPAEDKLHIAICQAVQEHHGPSANAILRTALNDYKPTQLTRMELIRVQQRSGSGEVSAIMVSAPASPAAIREEAVPQICNDDECCAQCCLNPKHEHYRGRSITGGFTCECCQRNMEVRINGKFCNECAGYHAATTPPSTPAKAAEEIQDWNEHGEGQGSHDADVAFIQAIIERCFSARDRNGE